MYVKTITMSKVHNNDSDKFDPPPRANINTSEYVFKEKSNLNDKNKYVRESQKYELRNNCDFRIKYKQIAKAEKSMFYICRFKIV